MAQTVKITLRDDLLQGRGKGQILVFEWLCICMFIGMFFRSRLISNISSPTAEAVGFVLVSTLRICFGMAVVPHAGS